MAKASDMIFNPMWIIGGACEIEKLFQWQHQLKALRQILKNLSFYLLIMRFCCARVYIKLYTIISIAV